MPVLLSYYLVIPTCCELFFFTHLTIVLALKVPIKNFIYFCRIIGWVNTVVFISGNLFAQHVIHTVYKTTRNNISVFPGININLKPQKEREIKKTFIQSLFY